MSGNGSKRLWYYGDDPNQCLNPSFIIPGTLESAEASSKKLKEEDEMSYFPEKHFLELLQHSGDEEDFNGRLSSEDEEEDNDNVCGHYVVMLDQQPTHNQSPNCKTISQWSPARPVVPLIPFTRCSGGIENLISDEPIDFFFHIFTDDFFELIINETNYQAYELMNQSDKPRSRIREWKPLTREELEVFLGLIFLTGHIDVPSISNYWQVNSLYNFPAFRNAMSRDRFLLILKALAFGKSGESGETKPIDPLYKITPLFDLFHNRMKEIYYPTKELGLDESTIFWKQKLGIKFYNLIQPDGLVIKTRPYCGSTDLTLGGKGHVEKVVTYLLYEYFGVGHSVYMNNVYASVELANLLLSMHTYITGTLKGNLRGNPVDVINKKLQRGQVAAAYSQTGVCVLKWRDKKEIVAISSEFGANLTRYTNRTGKISHKPEVILKYDEFMGGIDVSEQLLTYYPCQRKNIRWYAKVGLHLLHTVMNNAYVLYKKLPDKRNTRLLDFRESVITELIYKNRPPLSVAPSQPKSMNKEVHVISRVARNANNRLIRKRCAVCTKNQKRVETTYFCNDCIGKPGLCMEPCFKLYHKYI